MDSQPGSIPQALAGASAGASAGAWLKPLLDEQWHDMHAVVPRGFPAYARIFHPLERDRPQDTGSWHGHELPAMGELEQQRVGWAAVARAFGTLMHPLAQFHRLMGPVTPMLGPLDEAGWRYSKPDIGNLATDVLAAVATHLCNHTGTPDEGVSAIWEGWGGLATSAGYAELRLSDDGQWDNPLSREPGSGLLSAEVADGEKLELPNRSYYLFSAGPRFYTDPEWVNCVPWHHSPQWPQSPSILWPADRSWVMVSDVDFDSTVVAGSRELIAALVQDPAVEALALGEGADLTWDADVPNRPAAGNVPHGTPHRRLHTQDRWRIGTAKPGFVCAPPRRKCGAARIR